MLTKPRCVIMTIERELLFICAIMRSHSSDTISIVAPCLLTKIMYNDMAKLTCSSSSAPLSPNMFVIFISARTSTTTHACFVQYVQTSNTVTFKRIVFILCGAQAKMCQDMSFERRVVSIINQNDSKFWRVAIFRRVNSIKKKKWYTSRVCPRSGMSWRFLHASKQKT